MARGWGAPTARFVSGDCTSGMKFAEGKGARSQDARHGPPCGLAGAVAWRNLWRNRRRTWLAAGGVAFATGLILFSMSMQVGGYATQIETATAFFAGHVQIQRRDYIDRARFEHTIQEATPLLRALEAHPEVLVAAPRVQAFALASVDERSFGVQLLGVDAQRERRAVRWLDRISRGRMATAADEAVLGAPLARNLGADLGGEVVVLGAGKQGGVAAMAVRVTGLFDSGIAELDRSLMLVPLEAVQGAFGLGDEVHALVLRSAEAVRSGELAQALNAELLQPLTKPLPKRPRSPLPDESPQPEADSWLGETDLGAPNGIPAQAGELLARDWRAVLPELRQSIELDRWGSLFMYGIIVIVVTFSVVNTFIMTVFERTREFGMLRAIGMRPGAIMGMVQLEALCVWLLGVGLAFALLVPLIGWTAAYGIPLGEDIQALAQDLFMPDRLYPKLSLVVLLTAPLIMLVGVQLAAFAPSLRIRRLTPVTALRTE